MGWGECGGFWCGDERRRWRWTCLSARCHWWRWYVCVLPWQSHTDLTDFVCATYALTQKACNRGARSAPVAGLAPQCPSTEFHTIARLPGRANQPHRPPNLPTIENLPFLHWYNLLLPRVDISVDNMPF